MRINGEWHRCDDGTTRPVLRCHVRGADGTWWPTSFLVDTGADQTVLSAELVALLGVEVRESTGRLGGVGGTTEAVIVAAAIRLQRDDGGFATFRGEYAAFTRLETLDMSVLGKRLARSVHTHRRSRGERPVADPRPASLLRHGSLTTFVIVEDPLHVVTSPHRIIA